MTDKRIVILLFLSLTLFVGFGGGKRAEPLPSPTPVASVSPAPSPAPGVKAQFVPVDYYTTPAERAKIIRAGGEALKMVQGKCVHNFIASRKMIQTNGLTNLQVADMLPKLVGIIPVKMYYKCMHFNVFKCPAPTSAVAYRMTGDPTINLNRAYFDVSDDDRVWGATQLHEGLGHALGGFSHDMQWSLSRSFSVPYTLGGADQSQGGDVVDACWGKE